MKSQLSCGLSAFALAVCLGGCTTTTTSLPMSYQIPIGNSQVSNAFGVQNLSVNATQDVTVPPNSTLYYQVISPVNLTFYVFDKTGNIPGGTLLGKLQGTTFTSQAISRTGTLEFVFSADQMNTGGTVQFNVSDRPLAPATPVMMPAAAPAPTTQTTTTQTTTTIAPAPAPGMQDE
jgi:hypothetical protein